jgi:hypothetical protein
MQPSRTAVGVICGWAGGPVGRWASAGYCWWANSVAFSCQTRPVKSPSRARKGAFPAQARVIQDGECGFWSERAVWPSVRFVGAGHSICRPARIVPAGPLDGSSRALPYPGFPGGSWRLFAIGLGILPGPMHNRPLNSPFVRGYSFYLLTLPLFRGFLGAESVVHAPHIAIASLFP